MCFMCVVSFSGVRLVKLSVAFDCRGLCLSIAIAGCYVLNVIGFGASFGDSILSIFTVHLRPSVLFIVLLTIVVLGVALLLVAVKSLVRSLCFSCSSATRVCRCFHMFLVVPTDCYGNACFGTTKNI